MEKLEPKLRFPEFVGEWEKKILGDVGDVKMCRRIFNEETMPSGDIPFYKIGSFGKDADAFISKELYIEYRRKFSFPKKGDILISAAGTIGRTVVYNGEDAYYQDSNIVWIDNDNSKVSNEYLYFILQIVKYNTEGGTIQRLYNSILKSTKFTCPSLPEQTKIANFLTAVDDKLSQLKKKKSLLEQYKKGLMQKIFSQELRFKSDDGGDFADWEEKKLGEIGTFFSGGTPLTTKREYFNGNIPFIRSGEINSNKTEQFITELGLKNSSAKMVDIGDLIYALYGATSGEVAISKINGAINQAILCIRTEHINRFLYYYLFLNKEIIIKTYLQGGQGNLSADIIKSISVPIPSLPEQTQIANFLSAIDEKINHCSVQIEKMEGWKKGLLQQMFV